MENIKGKVSLKIEKSFYDASAKISASEKSSKDEKFCGSSTLASCNSNSDCKIGGCSSQVCQGKNEEITTTCEYKECYDAGKYNLDCKCVNKKCSWGWFLFHLQNNVKEKEIRDNVFI